MKRIWLFLFVCCSLLPAKAQEPVKTEEKIQERAEVLLETTEGNIRMALYNETPLHRDNFMKLVKMHVYDSLLFHRVVKDFMIQGGDLNSKHAQPGQRLGTGELDYTIEPEIRLPQLYHRRGVVAAARESDDVNPERRSGACQFYIVWGKVFNDITIGRAMEKVDSATQGKVTFTPEMIETYMTKGGTPHLDGQYTVFGEVLEGMDVVEKIQQEATDKYNRPYKDVRILKASLTKDPFQPVEKPQPKKKPVKRRRR